jgi:hypothetical protein
MTKDIILNSGGAACRTLATMLLLGNGLVASAVFAETKIGADVSLSAAYNDRGSNGGGALPNGVNIVGDFAPHIIFEGPVSSWSINGGVRHSQYISNSRDTTEYRALGVYQGQWDQRTEASFSTYYNRSNLSNILVRPDLVVGGDPTLPPIIDPTLAVDGNNIVTTFGANGSISRSLSARDNVGVNAGFSGNRNTATTLREFNSYHAGLSYSRTLNQRLSLGVTGTASKTNYLRTNLGDATSFSPQATVNYRINAAWTLNAAAGMSFQRFDSPIGKSSTSGFQGSTTLCRKGDRSNFCALAQYGFAPSTFNGVARTLSGGVNYQYKLSPRTSLSAFASYSRSKSGIGVIGSNVEYGSVGVGANRTLSRRLTAFASTNYGKNWGGVLRRPSTFMADIGLRLALGQ